MHILSRQKFIIFAFLSSLHILSRQKCIIFAFLSSFTHPLTPKVHHLRLPILLCTSSHTKMSSYSPSYHPLHILSRQKLIIFAFLSSFAHPLTPKVDHIRIHILLCPSCHAKSASSPPSYPPLHILSRQKYTIFAFLSSFAPPLTPKVHNRLPSYPHLHILSRQKYIIFTFVSSFAHPLRPKVHNLRIAILLVHPLSPKVHHLRLPILLVHHITPKVHHLRLPIILVHPLSPKVNHIRLPIRLAHHITPKVHHLRIPILLVHPLSPKVHHLRLPILLCTSSHAKSSSYSPSYPHLTSSHAKSSSYSPSYPSLHILSRQMFIIFAFLSSFAHPLTPKVHHLRLPILLLFVSLDHQ